MAVGILPPQAVVCLQGGSRPNRSTTLYLNDNAWPRAVPRPVPSDEGACLCPPWCSRFFGRETEETFFSHTNIKYFLLPVTLSAQTTYRLTPIHRPPNPADLSRTMESRGGGDPLTGLERQTGQTWPVFPRSVPLNLFSINKTYRLQPDTFVRFEAMEFL